MHYGGARNPSARRRIFGRMRTITIELPDETTTSDDVRMRVAVALYNNRALSLGQCAALAGFADRWEFMEKSAPYGGLKMGPQTPEEFDRELEAGRRHEH